MNSSKGYCYFEGGSHNVETSSNYYRNCSCRCICCQRVILEDSNN